MAHAALDVVDILDVGGFDVGVEPDIVAFAPRPRLAADLVVHDDRAELTFEGRTLDFPEHVGDALEFVLGTDEPFRPSDLPGTLDDEGRLAFVARLVREGLLVSR